MSKEREKSVHESEQAQEHGCVPAQIECELFISKQVPELAALSLHTSLKRTSFASSSLLKSIVGVKTAIEVIIRAHK